MQAMITYAGGTVPVRDGFNIWPPGWSAAEEAEMLAAWRAMEPTPLDYRSRTAFARDLEAWKRGGCLTARQAVLLDAWTNRRNIDAALAWIAPHSFADLGFETACQVHGNRAERPCGCAFHVVFDHHKREALEDGDVQPFRVEAVCAHHGRLNSMAAQFWTSAFDSGPEAATWRPRGVVVSSADDLARQLPLRAA